MLIVTIIVIIILAAAVILTVGKNNPVDSAKEAAFKEDLRSFQDELALSISKDYTAHAGQRDTKFNAADFDKIKDYIPSFSKKYNDKFVIVNDELKYVGDEEKEVAWSKDLAVKTNPVVPAEWKATIADITEDGVPIPKGFTYVTGTKETGTVIKDSLDNEFVWIPATEDTYVKDFSFPSEYSATASNTRDDKLPKGIIDETADVKKYGGFYIGRYEAGVPDNQTTIDGMSEDTSNTTGVPVSKQGATVWTYIDYTNSKANAESMISNEYVQTGLLTGKAWDSTCHFIEGYITTLNANSSLFDSRYYGNYINSLAPANITGDVVKRQVAGYSDKWRTKNIYDLAGNVWEWTAETFSSGYNRCGGGFGNNGDGSPVSYCSNNISSYTLYDVGFRCRLYIK